MSNKSQECWKRYREEKARKPKSSVYTMKPRQGFTQIENQIFALKSLNARQKYLFLYLKSNDQTGFRATIETMAELCGISRSTLNDDLNHLVSVGAIKIHSCKNTRNQPKSGKVAASQDEKQSTRLPPHLKNLYTVYPEGVWLPAQFQRERQEHFARLGKPDPASEESAAVSVTTESSLRNAGPDLELQATCEKPSLRGTLDLSKIDISSLSQVKARIVAKIQRLSESGELMDWIRNLLSAESAPKDDYAQAVSEVCQDLGIHVE